MEIATETVVPALPKYRFKIAPELAKALASSTLAYLVMTFRDFKPETVLVDPGRFLWSFVIGLGVSLALVFMAWLGPGQISTS